MVKKSTSIFIEEMDWRRWRAFVALKYGTKRGAVSEALTDAMKHYMEYHEDKEAK